MSQAWGGTIPIYINNFNWLRSTQDLAEFFAEVPGTEVVIVDNSSTYEPLLEWYSSPRCRYRVIRLTENLGSQAAWHCGAVLPPAVHRSYFGSAFYVVTDPDLCFAGCPKDVLEVLISGFEAYPEVTKAGVSLEINDLPSNSEISQEIVGWEAQFWTNRRDARFFSAAVDTTFALYGIGVAANGNSLRSDRPYTARHLPWYFAPNSLTDEQKFYLTHAQRQGWTSQLRKYLALDEIAAVVASDSTAEPPVERSLRENWRPTTADRSRYDPQWAVSRELEEAILTVLEVYCPQSILETGPGLSSIAIYRYRREFGAVEYWHVDHRGPANATFQEHLRELGVSGDNGFVCDLTEEYYDLSQVDIPAGRRFEFVLLDGPPASHQRASATQREFIRRHGGPDSIYIQDDTHRGPEASVIATLVKRFGTDHFLRYDIHDQTYPWRISSLLIPRSRCPNPTGVLGKLSGALLRSPL